MTRLAISIITFLGLTAGSLNACVFRSDIDATGAVVKMSNYGLPFTFATHVGGAQTEFSGPAVVGNLLVAIAIVAVIDKILNPLLRQKQNARSTATNPIPKSQSRHRQENG